MNYSTKTVTGRVARALRLVADALESEGYHIIMMPLPTENQFLAHVMTGGKNLNKINQYRADSGLWAVNPDTNIKIADKNWKGLYNGRAGWFRICHLNSLHIFEFASEEIIKVIGDNLPAGHTAEVLHNEKYSVVYIAENEPTELP